ncbi:MAG: molybdopterin converting factor subunit 1 [Bacteriovoracaceae bacterium]|nr:molybdopterin converting factor subunit 1 [Bacteriovoracaceae bacterium]
MKIKVRYFASLREKAGKSQEEMTIQTGKDLSDLYRALRLKYDFSLAENEIKYSVNNEYVEPNIPINENDVIVFIPPVAGG